MKRYFYISVVLALTFFLSCSDDDKQQISFSGDLTISANIEGMTGEAAVSRFGGGKQIGMFGVDYMVGDVAGSLADGVRRIDNVKYLQSAVGLVTDQAVDWSGAYKMDFYAYFPYDEEMSSVTNYLFKVGQNQDSLSTQGGSAYEYSDFLWAKVTSEVSLQKRVDLVFKHLLSKMSIYVRSDAVERGGLEGAVVRIKGLNLTTRLDLSQGQLVAAETPDVATVTAVGGEEVPAEFEVGYKAVVIPQVVSANTDFLEITTKSGHIYSYQLTDPLIFTSGTQRILEVSLVSGECSVRIGEITDWIDSGTESVGKATAFVELGDVYNRDGIQGIIFQVDESGKHGLLFSADKAVNYQWSSKKEVTGAVSETDGIANMEKVKVVNPDLTNYPAVKWCMDKNVNGVTGWYLPAANELEVLSRLYRKDKKFLNNCILESGLPGAEKFDVFEDYWSSTEDDQGWAFRVTIDQPFGSESIYKDRAYAVRAVHRF